MTKANLTHVDKSGNPAMVDVSKKRDTLRIAIAEGKVILEPETIKLIELNQVKKGDVLTIAKIAGIQGAKKTSNLVPLCHPLQLTEIKVDLWLDETKSIVNIRSIAKCFGKTGVEMEALTATAVAALTVYDMIKAVDRSARITDIILVEKHGGKSGDYFKGFDND